MSIDITRGSAERRLRRVHVVAGLTLASLGLVAVACAHEAGTAPGDMSVAEHEAQASEEQRVAAAHAAEYVPEASRTEEHCHRGKGIVCWTSTVNPTAEHGREAEEHHALAARHRAASAALRDAEARACAGIDEADRDMSPFAHREDIRAVAPLSEPRGAGRATAMHTTGAEVVFRAVPGMTAEWLQRLMDCHLARNAAIGFAQASEAMPYCPLAVAGAEALVRSVGDGFAVEVRGDDEAAAREILGRAERLRTPE